MYLDNIYQMLVTDGSTQYDARICIQNDIKRTRDQHYVLFDSIIQRCLGYELPDDLRIEDTDFTGADLGEWEDQEHKQRVLNTVCIGIVSKLTLCPDTERILNYFLGLVPDKTYRDKDDLVSEYTFERVSEPSMSIAVLTSDGKHKSIPKWSCIGLLHEDEETDIFHVPVDSDSLDSFVASCRSSEPLSLRMLSPRGLYIKGKDSDSEMKDLQAFVRPYQAYNKDQTVQLIHTANILAADIVVKAACLHLSHIIRKESRATYDESILHAGASKGQKRKRDGAHFKTFVTASNVLK